MNNGECGVDHPEFRKSAHTKARPLVSQWESHWSHLLLVHHAIMHLSMSTLSLSLCIRPICPCASSLVVFYMWHSRSKLKTQIYCCDSNKPNASKANQTKPNHLSLFCIFIGSLPKLLVSERETYMNKGCYTLIIAMSSYVNLHWVYGAGKFHEYNYVVPRKEQWWTWSWPSPIEENNKFFVSLWESYWWFGHVYSRLLIHHIIIQPYMSK